MLNLATVLHEGATLDKADVVRTGEMETLRAPEGRYTYFAFISYKSQDIHWARWLRRQLQLYRLPARTRKRHPDVVRRCAPIFLDKTNLRPGMLDERLRDEVAASKYLIVICSKNACANSRYLDEELDFFLESGGDISRVVPLIVDESDDPVRECFPRRLRELSDRETIVAANVYDDGRRSALIKMVATMLELRVEELEGDEARRRARRRIMAAAFGVLLVTCMIALWDYFRVRTAYYLDYTEVRGVPEGIHALSKAEVSSMSEHYAIDYSRGAVRALRCENSAGVVVAESRMDRADRPAQATYEYRERGRLDRVTWMDESGETVLVLDYDSIDSNELDYISLRQPEHEGGGVVDWRASHLEAHSLASSSDESVVDTGRSDVVRYGVYYNDDGTVRELRYFADLDKSVGSDADGVSGKRFERDELGRVARVYYLSYVDGSYEVMSTKDGVAGMSLRYDTDGDLLEMGSVGKDGAARPNEEGVCYRRMAFEGHNLVEVVCLDADGAATRNEEGYAKAAYEYDARGNMLRESYLDSAGELVPNTRGFASAGYEYDERGGTTRVVYRGVDGEPTTIEGGYASARFEHDALGHMTKATYCGVDGEPVITDEGYATITGEYDELGNVTRLGFYGTDGRPMLIYGGYSSIVFAYDSRGNTTKVCFCGVDDKPVMFYDTYATIVRTYDVRDNMIQESYYGVDGKPVLIEGGYASVCVEYDSHGNVIRESYQGVGGEPVTIDDGFSSATFEYDERGNVARVDYLGIDGEPVEIEGGYASATFEYDARGKLTRVNHYDAGGALC